MKDTSNKNANSWPQRLHAMSVTPNRRIHFSHSMAPLLIHILPFVPCVTQRSVSVLHRDLLFSGRYNLKHFHWCRKFSNSRSTLEPVEVLYKYFWTGVWLCCIYLPACLSVSTLSMALLMPCWFVHLEWCPTTSKLPTIDPNLSGKLLLAFHNSFPALTACELFLGSPTLGN